MSGFDPYGVLGIEPGAGPEEVRAAFRKAVRQQHPDTAANTDAAGVRDVLDAYRLLTDPAARARLEAADAGSGRSAVAPATSPTGGVTARRSRCPTCSACRGRGVVRSVMACAGCHGTGETTLVDIGRAQIQACRSCSGRGAVVRWAPCPNCGGSGDVAAPAGI